MTTRGDQILDRSLSKVGGKGLFVKELETALLEGRARLAVHSLKDVPMQLAPEFKIAAILAREDPRDAVVCARTGSSQQLADLPAGARVGTSSVRRALMLRAAFPHLSAVSVRGNVGTRLHKLDSGEFDALVMAAAGLKRLGLADRISSYLPVDLSLPAPGQGAVAIEICSDDADVFALVAPLADAATTCAVEAERAVSRGLGGSCDIPLAAYAHIDHGQMKLSAWVGSAVTGERIEVTRSGSAQSSLALADEVLDALKARGAAALIQHATSRA